MKESQNFDPTMSGSSGIVKICAAAYARKINKSSSRIGQRLRRILRLQSILNSGIITSRWKSPEELQAAIESERSAMPGVIHIEKIPGSNRYHLTVDLAQTEVVFLQPAT